MTHAPEIRAEIGRTFRPIRTYSKKNLIIQFHGEREARTYGDLGAVPQWGPGANPMVRGLRGRSLLKLESLFFSR